MPAARFADWLLPYPQKSAKGLVLCTSSFKNIIDIFDWSLDSYYHKHSSLHFGLVWGVTTRLAIQFRLLFLNVIQLRQLARTKSIDCILGWFLFCFLFCGSITMSTTGNICTNKVEDICISDRNRPRRFCLLF